MDGKSVPDKALVGGTAGYVLGKALVSALPLIWPEVQLTAEQHASFVEALAVVIGVLVTYVKGRTR